MVRRKLSVFSRAATAVAAVLASGSVLSEETSVQSGEAVERFSPAYDVGVLVSPETGYPPLSGLMRAAANRDLNEIDRLVEAGADLNETDIHGRTPLSNAAGAGFARVVARLMQHGADPDIVAVDGNSALTYAVRMKNNAIIGTLLDGGANPNQIVGKGGQSLLAYAAVTNQVTVASALLSADVNLDVEGVKALNNAIWKGNEEIVAMLLASGIDVNVPVHNQQSPLHSAAGQGALNTVIVLLDMGADANSQNTHGQTPLTVAIEKGHATVAERLLLQAQTASSSDLRAAVGRGQTRVALALLDKLDVDSLSSAVLNEMLIAAEIHADSGLLTRLLQIHADRRSIDGDPRFVFVRSMPDECQVGRWNMTSDAQEWLYLESGPCSQTFYVEEKTESLFVIDRGTVKTISVTNGRVLAEDALPVTMIDDAARGLSEQWSSSFGEDVAFEAQLTIEAVGYTEEGDLGFAASTTGPADGWYSYLFVRSGGAWRMLDEQSCHRFSNSCGFTELNGRRLADRQSKHAVWHPSVRLNPYFAGKHSIPLDDDTDWPSWSGTVRLQFNGRETTIFHDAREGGHCADDCIYALNVGLAFDDGAVEFMSNHAIGHWIVGQYLLIRPSRTEPYRLIDLHTGDAVFDKLQSATWLF